MKLIVTYIVEGCKVIAGKYSNTVTGNRRAIKKRNELAALGFSVSIERKNNV